MVLMRMSGVVIAAVCTGLSAPMIRAGNVRIFTEKNGPKTRTGPPWVHTVNPRVHTVDRMGITVHKRAHGHPIWCMRCRVQGLRRNKAKNGPKTAQKRPPCGPSQFIVNGW